MQSPASSTFRDSSEWWCPRHSQRSPTIKLLRVFQPIRAVIGPLPASAGPSGALYDRVENSLDLPIERSQHADASNVVGPRSRDIFYPAVTLITLMSLIILGPLSGAPCSRALMAPR